MGMASVAWCGHRGTRNACGNGDKRVEIRQAIGRPTRADIAVPVEYQLGFIAIGRRPEQGKDHPDIARHPGDGAPRQVPEAASMEETAQRAQAAPVPV